MSKLNPKESKRKINWDSPLIGHSFNAILVVATIFTFFQTQKSVDVTLETYLHEKKKDSTEEKREAIKDSLQNIKDSIAGVKKETKEVLENKRVAHIDSLRRKEYEMSLKSLQTQVKALKESNRQFDFFNEPYLNVQNPIVKQFEIGKTIISNFDIENLGYYPYHK